MLITLFTDVSHDHRSRIGAYAWWAKVNGLTFRGAGVFRDAIENNNVAELCGLINGVFAAINEIKPEPGSKFIAQSDSGVAIAVLRGQTNDKYATLRQVMMDKLTRHGLQVEYRHVKAHKGNATPRNAVNSWCDRTARALMKARRSQLVPG